MNYISSKINKKINFLISDNKPQELKIYYQSKFEFYIIYILGYLWNKNWSTIEDTQKEHIINCILKPSIGTIVSIIRKLDLENEFFGNKKLKVLYQLIDKYPTFRNEKIGHGFSYEDDVNDFLEFFKIFFDEIESYDSTPIFQNADIVKVSKEENDLYRGIIYKADGATYLSWSCPKQLMTFETGQLYLYLNNNQYVKISPFIILENEDEFYSFCSIEEKLTGRTKYNRLLKTSYITRDVFEFEKLSISQDRIKRKSANGTVINIYENNFKKYIDIGITRLIINFLEKNKASVFATIWGHGGVGKTASIQRVAEILCNQERKIFDYIIFISAKDRVYNFYQGKVTSLSNRVTSLEDILITLNTIIFNTQDVDVDSIISYKGKLLIIIDDFETFNKAENSKILTFIKALDINHHKVVLTTRAATLVTGEEIQTKELNEEETIEFLVKGIINEVPSFNVAQLQRELKKKPIKNKIYEITSGRPLFILQLGIYIVQKGSISEALNYEINTTKEAINFLYDRIFEYLSADAKNMFLAISLLINENDLRGLLSNLQFILSKEDSEDDFNNSLNELIKLKIIELDGRDFFKVYSLEIYKLMKIYYQNKGVEFDGNIYNRFNLINTDNNSSTELALLENADASRMFDSEAEVENKYRYILNRDKSPFTIKKTALFNFASYLIINKKKIEKAIKLYQDYYHIFKKDIDYTLNYSMCCWSNYTAVSKYQAVTILQEFISKRPKLSQEKYLDLIGILTTYKSILVIGERDDLKSQLRFNEINKDKYNLLFNEQKERMRDIFQYPGGYLYKLIKNIDLMTLSAGCRNNVLDGLIQFVELSIRNNKRDAGREVCLKVIEETTQNYHAPFLVKLSKINSIDFPNASHEDVAVEKSTLLGEKLKEAFNMKDNKS